MKKILINLLAISGVAVAVVACNSGSSSNSGPAAPSASQITPPDGFASGGTTGVYVNAANGQVAIPTSTGYSTLQLTGAAYAALAANATTATFASSGSTILMTIPASTPDGAATVYAISAVASQAAKSLTAISTTAESYQITGTPTSNEIIATVANQPVLVYGTATALLMVSPNSSSVPVPTTITLPAGSGEVSAVQAASVNGVDYLSAGTANGKVYVANGANLTVTDLSAQAPSRYTPGNVNSFGLPSTLQTNTQLVGYWNVGTVNSNVNIYRITGTYVNGQPTGTGFLNTTVGGSQMASSGTTAVTFTNFPANDKIYSSYVDSVGQVWVGTTQGQVYVLRTGATQWTQVALASGVTTGNVEVGYNNATSGAIAIVTGSTQNGMTYSVN